MGWRLGEREGSLPSVLVGPGLLRLLSVAVLAQECRAPHAPFVDFLAEDGASQMNVTTGTKHQLRIIDRGDEEDTTKKVSMQSQSSAISSGITSGCLRSSWSTAPKGKRGRRAEPFCRC